MDRRSFIKGLLFTGGLIGISGNAVAALVIGDRYKRLITGLNDLHQAKVAMGTDWFSRPVRDHHQLHQSMGNYDKTNAVLAVLVEDFGDMTPLKIDYLGTMDKVQAILQDRFAIDVMSEESLRQHEDIIVSVATMRYLLATIKAPVHDRKIVGDNLNILMRRYSDLINGRIEPTRPPRSYRKTPMMAMPSLV